MILLVILCKGHMYSEADNSPFGGWIAVNKVTGEFAVCEAPEDQQEDRKRYVRTS